MVTKPIEHAVGHDLPRRVGRDVNGSGQQVRVGILDQDAPDSRQAEHGAVVAGVARDQDLLESDVEPGAEPVERVALGGGERQDIQVAGAGVNEMDVEIRFGKPLLDQCELLRIGAGEEPA